MNIIQMARKLKQTKYKGARLMDKQEMIAEIRSLCNANENNPYCSVYWLADLIMDIVDSGDLKEEISDD